MNSKTMTFESVAGSTADKPTLVPEDEYLCEILRWRSYEYLGRATKAAIAVEIVADRSGDTRYAGTVLERHWNIKRFDADRQEIEASGWKCDFVREFVMITGHPVEELARIQVRNLIGSVAICRTRTVSQDRDGDPLHELARYSVIGKITGSAAESLELIRSLGLHSSSSSSTPSPHPVGRGRAHTPATVTVISDRRVSRSWRK